jgi:hypothetical protein
VPAPLAKFDDGETYRFDDPLAEFDSELESAVPVRPAVVDSSVVMRPAVGPAARVKPPAHAKTPAVYAKPAADAKPAGLTRPVAAPRRAGRPRRIPAWAATAVTLAAALAMGGAVLMRGRVIAEDDVTPLAPPPSAADVVAPPDLAAPLLPRPTPEARPIEPERPAAANAEPARPRVPLARGLVSAADVARRATEPSVSVAPAPALSAGSPVDVAAGVSVSPRRLEPPAAPKPTDREQIQGLLDAYRLAYERLDVISVARLWPGVDTQALRRAFGTIRRQRVQFGRCAIAVDGTQANADCAGVLEYVRNVGETAPQSRSTAWTFVLDRNGGEWRITRVVAR